MMSGKTLLTIDGNVQTEVSVREDLGLAVSEETMIGVIVGIEVIQEVGVSTTVDMVPDLRVMTLFLLVLLRIIHLTLLKTDSLHYCPVWVLLQNR
jgi:hypothetical protein